MREAKKITNSIILGMLMSLCLVVITHAEEVPAGFVFDGSALINNTETINTSIPAKDTNAIPTLENSIEQKTAEEIAAGKEQGHSLEGNVLQLDIPQAQDNNFSLASIILISTSIMALLVLVANRIYIKMHKGK